MTAMSRNLFTIQTRVRFEWKWQSYTNKSFPHLQPLCSLMIRILPREASRQKFSSVYNSMNRKEHIVEGKKVLFF